MRVLTFGDDDDAKLHREMRREISGSRREIESLKAKVDELQDRKDHSLRNLVAGGVIQLAVAVVGGGALIFSTHQDPAPVQPAPISCTDEREKAKEIYETDGGWTQIPESSPLELQCDLNTYIGDQPESPPPAEEPQESAPS